MSTKEFDDQLAKIRELIREYDLGLLLQGELAAGILNEAEALLEIGKAGPAPGYEYAAEHGFQVE